MRDEIDSHLSSTSSSTSSVSSLICAPRSSDSVPLLPGKAGPDDLQIAPGECSNALRRHPGMHVCCTKCSSSSFILWRNYWLASLFQGKWKINALVRIILILVLLCHSLCLASTQNLGSPASKHLQLPKSIFCGFKDLFSSI